MKRVLALLVAGSAFVGACHHGPHGGHSYPQGETLTEVAVAVPIAPGKTEEWRAALADLVGPRYAEYDASRHRYGVTSQMTFLQRTPMGDFALIHLTSSNVQASFRQMSESSDAWDVSWRRLTQSLHGMDFSKGEEVTPKLEPAFSMEATDVSGAKPYMFAVPLAADRIERFRAAAREMMTARRAEYQRAREAAGVLREVAFLEQTHQGAAVVFYWLARDPAASLERVAKSEEPFDRLLSTTAAELHGIPLGTIEQTVASNTLVAAYPKEK